MSTRSGHGVVTASSGSLNTELSEIEQSFYNGIRDTFNDTVGRNPKNVGIELPTIDQVYPDDGVIVSSIYARNQMNIRSIVQTLNRLCTDGWDWDWEENSEGYNAHRVTITLPNTNRLQSIFEKKLGLNRAPATAPAPRWFGGKSFVFLLVLLLGLILGLGNHYGLILLPMDFSLQFSDGPSPSSGIKIGG